MRCSSNRSKQQRKCLMQVFPKHEPPIDSIRVFFERNSLFVDGKLFAGVNRRLGHVFPLFLSTFSGFQKIDGIRNGRCASCFQKCQACLTVTKLPDFGDKHHTNNQNKKPPNVKSASRKNLYTSILLSKSSKFQSFLVPVKMLDFTTQAPQST